MLLLYDVHCHIHSSPTLPLLPHKTKKICLMGTQPNDWNVVSSLAQHFPERIRPAFGIHPWFASQFTVSDEHQVPEWEEKLKDFLLRHPKAIVGEIGRLQWAGTRD